MSTCTYSPVYARAQLNGVISLSGKPVIYLLWVLKLQATNTNRGLNF